MAEVFVRLCDFFNTKTEIFSLGFDNKVLLKNAIRKTQKIYQKVRLQKLLLIYFTPVYSS